jgi:hypothetical protein
VQGSRLRPCPSSPVRCRPSPLEGIWTRLKENGCW